MAVSPKYLEIMTKFQRALKTENFSEIDQISLDDLKLARVHLTADRDMPYYQLLLDKVQDRGKINEKRLESKSCGPLSKNSCDQEEYIRKNYKDNNIFLDIPYDEYYEKEQEKILRDLVELAKLNPVVAKDKITSNDVLCKVCRMIRTCKYGLADISFNRHSVSFELGLMFGVGIPVCILLFKGKDNKFSDIKGIEHQEYQGEKSLAIKFSDWLLQNAHEADNIVLGMVSENNKKALQVRGEKEYKLSAKQPKVTIFDVLD